MLPQEKVEWTEVNEAFGHAALLLALIIELAKTKNNGIQTRFEL
jgi:hypothetical protein